MEAKMKFEKIEIFGDSVLRGVMYDEVLGSYRLRDGHTLEKLSGSGAKVTNNSRMGATVDRGLALVEKKLENCAEGTLVIFEYGGNDCDHNWEEVSASPEGDHFPHKSPLDFKEAYRNLILKAKSKGAYVATTSLVPIDCAKYMKWISKNLSYDNILKWLGDESMLFRWQEYYSHIVENLARELGCLFIDLRSEFLLSHEYPSLLGADGIHPTQKGHEMIERTLEGFVLA